MKKINQHTTKALLLALLCCKAFLFTACSDDDTPLLPPEVELNIEEEAVTMTMGEQLSFNGTNTNAGAYQESWTLNEVEVGTGSGYDFIPDTSGRYTLTYRAYNDAGEFTHTYTITVAAKIRPITDVSNPFVTALLAYTPAPGQYINKNLGNLESAEASLGGKTGLVSLGAWGGSISYAFDHTVLNTPNAKDLVVYGNAYSNFAEPGIIWVMQDENANGLADDTWYELKGSGYEQEGSIRDYSITYFKPESDDADIAWEDNQGNTGSVLKNNFHKQAWFPQWIEGDSYTLTGTLLTDAHIDMSNPSYITSGAFEYGYADNTAGGDEIDLSDAIDADGNPVNLSGIDFIKIQTGIQVNMGWLGELSTEVAGVADLALIEK